MTRKYTWSPEARERNRERMKKLNADPAFAERNRERNRERMKKLNADPARNLLAGFTAEQRRLYKKAVAAGVDREVAREQVRRCIN